MRLRRRALPARVGADVRPLLSLPRLPAPDRQRLRLERAHRNESGDVPFRRDRARSRADRERPAASHRSMRQMQDGAVERIWRRRQAALHARRHARRPRFFAAQRAYLHAVETALGRPARRGSSLRGLLRFQDALAASKPRAAKRDLQSSAGLRGMTSTANRSRPLRYSASAKWMHWVIACVVILMIPEGMTMKRLVEEGPTRDNLYNLHEAVGACVLIVVVLRLARRFLFGVPAPDETLSPAERDASLAAQYALYLLLLVVPVLGWAATNAYGDPVSVFGLFNFPALVGKDVALSDRIFVWHLAGGLLIAAIVAVHSAAALYHHFVKRDAVLARMLPRD